MLGRLISVASPVNRVTLAAFVWTHRHTVLRWGRSLVRELRSPGDADPRRLTTIGRVLLAITRDDRLASSRHLRRVELIGDTVVADVPARWQGRARLADVLADVAGVGAVADTAGRPIEGTIPTTTV